MGPHLGRDARRLRRAAGPLRHGGHVVDGARDRGAARDRDRTLPERARAARRRAASSARSWRLLAAVPSVMLGLWGILVLGPFVPTTSSRGSTTLSASSRSSAARRSRAASSSPVLVLAIMVVPIVASICRELFVSVPNELKEGALALGATRWEMVRGVVLPYFASGDRGRGDPGSRPGDRRGDRRHAGDRRRLDDPVVALRTGDTLASRIAGQYQGAVRNAGSALVLPRRRSCSSSRWSTNFLAQLIVQRSVRGRRRLMARSTADDRSHAAAAATRRRRGSSTGWSRRSRRSLRSLAVAVLGHRRRRRSSSGAECAIVGFLTGHRRSFGQPGRRDPARDRRHAILVGIAT